MLMAAVVATSAYGPEDNDGRGGGHGRHGDTKHGGGGGHLLGADGHGQRGFGGGDGGGRLLGADGHGQRGFGEHGGSDGHHQGGHGGSHGSSHGGYSETPFFFEARSLHEYFVSTFVNNLLQKRKVTESAVR